MDLHIMSIGLQWDKLGRISLNSIPRIPLTEYQRSDGIAASVPMLLSGQLGVLRPNYALALCGRLLALLETGQAVVEPINSALKNARIELYHRGDSICRVYLTFHPQTGFIANNDSVEEGVRQLLYNYTGHILTLFADEFGGQTRCYILLSLLYYLDEVFTREANVRSFDPARPSFAAQKAMNEFARAVYSHWEKGYYPEETVKEMLRQAQKSHHDLCKSLSLKKQ